MAVNSVTPAHSTIRLEWMINVLDLYTKGSVFLESPTFTSGLNHDLTWQMKIGNSKPKHDYVSLYVRLIGSKNHAEVRAKLEFLIFRDTGIRFARETAISTFVPGTSADTFVFENFLSRVHLIPFMTGTINIVCEMEEINISDGAKDDVPFAIPACPIPDYLRSLFESKKFSDVELTISGQAFRAHKLVLVMHSPVFWAMFQRETVKKIRNEVEITDVTPAVFDEMLRFMYTGEVTDIEIIADGLLAAADEYAVDRLKVMCEEVLYKKVVVENAADTLILADKYDADQLKPKVLKFIASRVKDVMATKGFQSMVPSHPYLVAETLETVVEVHKL